MPALTRQQKVTFGEMRSSGVRGLLIYCADFHCSHSIAISADRWPDHVRLSDLEPEVHMQGLRPKRRRRAAGLPGQGDGVVPLMPWSAHFDEPFAARSPARDARRTAAIT